MALSARGAARLLSRAPTALFPIALGLAGLAGAIRTVADRFSATPMLAIGNSLLIVAAMVLAIDAALYLAKLFRMRSAVADDLATASRANLLAPGFMAAMVIGGAWHETNALGGALWLAASLGHLVLLLGFVGRWLTHDYSPDDLNPTWFLPAAGIMTAPMTWPAYGPMELPVVLLGIGGTVWIMLLPLVFRRIVFEPAVMPKLRPTLFITAAPFGLLAGALLTLFPDILTSVPLVFLSGGAFFILVLITHVRFLAEAGITLSWWATTFPVATIATGFFRLQKSDVFVGSLLGIGFAVLACLTTTIAVLATIRAAWRTCSATVAATEIDVAAMQGYRSDKT